MVTEDGPKKCPKCEYTRIHGDECPKCGLILSKYKAASENKTSPADQVRKATAAAAGRASLQTADSRAFYQIMAGVIIVLIGIIFISQHLFKVHTISSIDNDWKPILRIDAEAEINMDMSGVFVSSLKRRVEEGQETMPAAVKSAKRKSIFGIAGILMGTWLMFYGIGKREAVKRYPKAVITTASHAQTLEDIYRADEAFNLRAWGYCLLLLSAFNLFKMTGCGMDYFHWHALYGDSFESFGLRSVLFSGHVITVLLLLAAGACIQRAYRMTPPELSPVYERIRPSVSQAYTPDSRASFGKPDSDPDIAHAPVKVNLTALLSPRYLLIGLLIILTVGIAGYYYRVSKASKEFLRYNVTELEKHRQKFDEQRREIFRQGLAGRAGLADLMFGKCSLSGKEEFIAGLNTDTVKEPGEVTACFLKFKGPDIILPFLSWYQVQLAAGKYFAAGDIGDIIVGMQANAIAPLSDALSSLENKRVTDLAARLLAYIHSEESIRILADTITGKSNPAAYSAGKFLAIVVTSPHMEMDKGFQLLSQAYSCDEPNLRNIAIDTLSVFEGTAARNLALEATKDPEPEIVELAKKIIGG